MILYGIDFTSAPKPYVSRSEPGKSLTCAAGSFLDGTVRVRKIWKWNSFRNFERLLSRNRECVIGIDFPFGLPRVFIEAKEWEATWADYVQFVDELGKEEFERQVREYFYQPKREVDRLANSCSPLKLDYTPVGKMFFQGARRLLHSSASIIPLRSNNSLLHVVEAYPALVADKCGCRNNYKSDDRKKQTVEQENVRKKITAYLNSQGFRRDYGFAVQFATFEEEIVSDPTGDTLDAVLCIIQATWAYTKSEDNYGIPKDCDLAEGWIVDPITLLRSAPEEDDLGTN